MPETKPDYAVMIGLKSCPREELHNGDEPENGGEWLEWSQHKMQTHTPTKCPGCGLYRIWEPKDGAM